MLRDEGGWAKINMVERYTQLVLNVDPADILAW
jgi:hypothetical protein